MPWQLLIAISILLYSIAMILLRALAKENQKEPISYAIISQIITGAVIGIVGFLFADMSLPNLQQFLIPLLITFALYSGASVLVFKSLQQTEASRFTVILATRAFFTIVTAFIFLQESLTMKQLLGAFLIFAGVIAVNWQGKKFQFGKGELFALLAAICFGVVNVNDRYLTQHFNLYPYLTLSFIMPAILLSIIFPKAISGIAFFFKKKVWTKLLLVNVIYAFSAITFFAALQTGDSASQVATINITNIIVIVLLSIVFLKERNNIRGKIIGTILSFVGLLLIS